MLFVFSGRHFNNNVSCMNYYAYRLMIRQNTENYLLRYRRLFQQYLVDMYVKVETERLLYIRLNQSKLRSEQYIDLRDAIATDGDARNVGRQTILPSSYTGSPRHMHEYAQDAMTYVRLHGRPDLFITFTCNPKWIEITRLLFPGQQSIDRHDIVARVFRQKLKSLMDYITKHAVFGKSKCHMYSVEWQKRGLPHAHILLWLIDKIQPDQIDLIISAEIPDPSVDSKLHDIVIANMIHGPCGEINPLSPCMVNGKCSKRFPRNCTAETITGNDGYPLYRRRAQTDGGQKILKTVKGVPNIIVDNSWVVPFSPLLSKTFDAHINVEYCHSVKSIKYICKYVHKGSDMAAFAVGDQNRYDEITCFQVGRYVSSNEAVWRLFAFPIHDRYPAVIHLAVHLENGQRVYFTEATAVARAAQPPATTLTGFFEICRTDSFARTLLYSEMPRYYTWDKKFKRRLRGDEVTGHPGIRSADTIGRVYTVHPKNDECFYLRLLLVNVRGPTSFESLRTVGGYIHPTFRAACQALHLLENDDHWEYTLTDAVHSASACQVRALFAIIISTCFPSNPSHLWETFKDDMSEDILNRCRATVNDFELPMTDDMRNEALILIEDQCINICGNLLSKMGMPAPNRQQRVDFNREVQRELEYNIPALNRLIETNVPHMNQQQRFVYESLIASIDRGDGGLFFLDAPGGTGKTFLITLLLATIRSRSDIALATASSGIAATLMDGGRTAHSALKLPLNLQAVDDPICNISKTSAMAEVLKKCKLIVWDECTMSHKRALEALDRTMKDLRNNRRLFGGALILLSGDFRQTLPVIPQSTPTDQLNACLKKSFLWPSVKTLQLTTNMRVAIQNDPTAEIFSKQLLSIGDGQVPVDGFTGKINFPPHFCQFVPSKDALIDAIFPSITTNYNDHAWLSERAILAAKNRDVDALNSVIQERIPGAIRTYTSFDTVTNPDDATNFPIEFLNSLEIAGLPPHRLNVKVGSIVILLRNLNAPKLCNGTRLVIHQLKDNVVHAKILNGTFIGEEVLIPRIPMIPTDLPFDFKRIQFPLRLAFTMTINKAKGQTLSACGLDLETDCFSHGQLYVACSRVGKPSALHIYAPHHQTKNVVYEQALR